MKDRDRDNCSTTIRNLVFNLFIVVFLFILLCYLFRLNDLYSLIFFVIFYIKKLSTFNK